MEWRWRRARRQRWSIWRRHERSNKAGWCLPKACEGRRAERCGSAEVARHERYRPRRRLPSCAIYNCTLPVARLWAEVPTLHSPLNTTLSISMPRNAHDAVYRPNTRAATTSFRSAHELDLQRNLSGRNPYQPSLSPRPSRVRQVLHTRTPLPLASLTSGRPPPGCCSASRAWRVAPTRRRPTTLHARALRRQGSRW